MHFTENKELQRFERDMKVVPNFERKEVWEFADSCSECRNCDCKLDSCIEAHCPYIKRKIKSIAIITRDLVETFLLDNRYIPFAHRVIDILAKYNGNKLFVSMPSYSYEDSNGETKYADYAHPISKEAREAINSKVLDAYEQALEESEDEDEGENYAESEDEESEYGSERIR